jgi:hypothetical protein
MLAADGTVRHAEAFWEGAPAEPAPASHGHVLLVPVEDDLPNARERCVSRAIMTGLFGKSLLRNAEVRFAHPGRYGLGEGRSNGEPRNPTGIASFSPIEAS